MINIFLQNSAKNEFIADRNYQQRRWSFFFLLNSVFFPRLYVKTFLPRGVTQYMAPILHYFTFALLMPAALYVWRGLGVIYVFETRQNRVDWFSTLVDRCQKWFSHFFHRKGVLNAQTNINSVVFKNEISSALIKRN